ncbi:protein phosphatase 1 regulatory subunit 35 [Pimephales promelas]|uniref:protein phosphatase 1 regulatory subunit 35 n=1 Tax=Pimephales promelas TaxID=90988 RepID=UPI001955AB13|nr:protein phosphatase 1 regulatory subunit 35 [Pimephales promelas]XP_039516755.1 protein phosphatase 1 regulatory subunit 35 [Pimephales promelas]KAG1932393.1 protein phosphatase 1 regulatory subunit [Pimephales promelas]KAG1932395.1 protein phosphatase 1 regulatory subunit [Pimephales promelas]
MESTGEPHVRVAPEPLRVEPVQDTELICPDLDLSVSLTPERTADTHRRQVRFNVSPQCSVHPVIPEPRNIQARRPQNKDKHGHESAKGRDRVTSGVCDGRLTEGEELNMTLAQGAELLEGAELNTTLALRAELQEVAEQAFDPEKAVKEKLQSSTLTKNHISAKAAEGLNFPRSQHLYRALVSVSLSRDQLISQALQDRPALAPPTTNQTNKFPCPPLEAPDVLQFFSADKMLRETPLLPGNNIPLPRPLPAPRPAHTTFHLHHLHKVWES